MATPLTVRVVEHQAQIFRRFWRGSATFYVLNPVLFLSDTAENRTVSSDQTTKNTPRSTIVPDSPRPSLLRPASPVWREGSPSEKGEAARPPVTVSWVRNQNFFRITAKNCRAKGDLDGHTSRESHGRVRRRDLLRRRSRVTRSGCRDGETHRGQCENTG